MDAQLLISILSGFFILLGVLALLIGALGLLRLPDVYCRIHAVGMIDTAGASFIILGLAIHEGVSLVTVKLLFIGIFLFFTSPIATHAVAQVAHKSGVVPVGRNLVTAKATKKPAAAPAAAKAKHETSRKNRIQSKPQKPGRVMTSMMIDIFLLGLLVFIAVMILRTGKLFAVIVMSGGYSLTSAAIFVNLDAVDVAFTEAAVGAGISTVLFLAAMAFLPAEEKPARKNSTGFSHTLIATLVCMTAGLLLITAALDLPAFGDPNAPAQVHVAPRYLQESGDALHIPNVVTTVLASYRGFDTLGETIVVFTAGLGVLMLLAGATRTRRQSPTTKTTSNTKTKSKKGAQNG